MMFLILFSTLSETGQTLVQVPHWKQACTLPPPNAIILVTNPLSKPPSMTLWEYRAWSSSSFVESPPADHQRFAAIEVSGIGVLKILGEFEMISHSPHSSSFPPDHTGPCFLVLSKIGCFEVRISWIVLPIRSLDLSLLLDESVMHSKMPSERRYVMMLLIVCVKRIAQ